ncbi:MAG: ABC transporter ATP-binding protein [Anaerolineae bacterium]
MTRHFLKAIWPYLKQVSGLLILGSLGGIVMNTAVVLPAVLLGRAIDTATAWANGQGAGADVLWAGLAYAGGMALYQGARLVKRWGLRVGNRRIIASVRADALRGVLAWPAERLHRTAIGDLMARIIGDVEVMGRGISEITTETWDTLLFSFSLIAGMLAYDPGLTLLTLLPVPLAMLLAQTVGRWISTRTTATREANAALTAFLQERLTGLRVVRLFGRVEATVDRAAALSGRLVEANLALARLRGGLQPIYRLLMLGGVVFLLWLGGQRVAAGAMSLGAFVAYLDLYTRFTDRGHRVPQMFNSVQSGAAAYARLQPMLAPPLDEHPPLRTALRAAYVPGLDRPLAPLPERPPHALALTVRDVIFRYPGSEAIVLEQVSLDASAGTFVAITGPVGCGKSALARVMLGLYPLEGGQVQLDGVSLETLSPAERAARIGYLPQNPFLFSGRIRDNIQMTFPEPGQAAGQGDNIDQWVRLAALDMEGAEFSNGLDTEIGERGTRVSGGQRQRIALARAFAIRPGLLVLDDPFSAVDLDTEARIIAALRQTFGPTASPAQQATVIFFSHRLAAFPLADQVVVMDAGRIVARGTHEALLADGGLYARIYRAQQRVALKETAL